MSVTIRDYRPADEASWLRCRVLSFLDSAYYDDVRVTGPEPDPGAVHLVATAPKPEAVTTPGGEQVVGILGLEVWDDDGRRTATIDTIAVHPDHQRRGIADALLANGLARARGAGATVLEAWTREDRAANTWYVRNGFRVTDEYLHVYPDGEESDGFTSPTALSRPIKAFCHARLQDEAEVRDRYARVHRCRRYLRDVDPATWTEDPGIVATYDAENAGRPDHDFYLRLAKTLQAERVTDLGCGTGVLAADLAAAGHAVTGVDPAAAMLHIARTRPGGERVRWMQGTAADLPDDDADLVVMQGHVAQYFLTDAEWASTLDHIHRTLRPGGHVAFESRTPAARAWERWTREHTEETFPHPDGGRFTSWSESIAAAVADGYGAIETHEGHVVLPDGTHRVHQETLRFRPLELLQDSLAAAGFTLAAAWGDFVGSAPTKDSREFTLLARRR